MGRKSQESSLESAFDAREVAKEGAAMKASATCSRRWAPEDKRDPSRGARSDESAVVRQDAQVEILRRAASALLQDDKSAGVKVWGRGRLWRDLSRR